MEKAKKIQIIMGIGVPLFLVVAILISLYVPQFLQKPQYDFVYLVGDQYYDSFSVKNNHIIKNPPPSEAEMKIYVGYKEPRFFKYDIITGQRQEISFEEVGKFYLSDELRSPDGFEVGQGEYSHGFFPFYYDSRSNTALYINGHGYSKKLFEYSYADYKNIPRFFAWIIK